MIYSKYKKITLLFLPVLVLSTFFFLALSYLVLSKLVEDRSKLLLLIVPVFFSYLFFLVAYHLIYKWDLIEISSKEMVIKKCFGIGKAKTVDLTQITAFEFSEWVRFGGETLVIKSNGKKLTELSDFSYSNFNELKNAIKRRTPIIITGNKSFFESLK